MLINSVNPSAFLENGQVVEVPGSQLMDYARPYFISPAYAFVAYPNRNSAPFREFYNIPEAETVLRCNLRYQVFPGFVKVLVKLGWLDPSPKEWLSNGLSWAKVTQRAIGAADAEEG